MLDNGPGERFVGARLPAPGVKFVGNLRVGELVEEVVDLLYDLRFGLIALGGIGT